MKPLSALLLLLFSLACQDEEPPPRPQIFDCATDPCQDCVFIDTTLRGRNDYNFDLAQCETCQAAACGTSGCEEFPCDDGKHVVRACNEDTDCTGLAHFCGQFTATHNVCVNGDDV